MEANVRGVVRQKTHEPRGLDRPRARFAVSTVRWHPWVIRASRAARLVPPVSCDWDLTNQ
jgi:hypothetical protein